MKCINRGKNNINKNAQEIDVELGTSVNASQSEISEILQDCATGGKTQIVYSACAKKES